MDLIVVVADGDMEHFIRQLLSRNQSLGIHQITFEVKRHPQRDAGCLTDCHNYLREDIRNYQYSMVLFDREGCGREKFNSPEIEKEVEDRLSINGWKDRCAVLVIDPELEAWAWSDSPEVDKVFGWGNRNPPIRSWIKSNTNFWSTQKIKPERPKEALHAALKEVRQPLSAVLFADLAKSVSLERCADSSFNKFKDVLRKWFAC